MINYRFRLCTGLFAFFLAFSLYITPVGAAEETTVEPAASSETTEGAATEPAATPTPTPYVPPESYNWPIQSDSFDAWPAGPKVEAETACVMDVWSGSVLYAKNMNDKRYPASITKIMTTLLAVENSNMDDIVTFSENAVMGTEAGSSSIGILVGEQLTMEQCLYGVMLASANEVATAVAEHVAGSVDKFVDMMNEKAKALGCKNTHFNNANGLPDENHYTTAYDMALIAAAAYKDPNFAKITGTVSYTIPKTNLMNEERPLYNHHKMLSDAAYLYDGCVGGKTGYTEVALNTLVTYAKRDGKTLVCVDLRTNGPVIYTDTASMLDYGFDNFDYRKVSGRNATITTPNLLPAQFPGGRHYPFATMIQREPGKVLLPPDTNLENIKKSITFEDNAVGPNRKRTDYYLNDLCVGHSYAYPTTFLRGL